MIVVGIDPHKRTHTAVALEAPGGTEIGRRTVNSDAQGRVELLKWATALGQEHRFAVEDGRPYTVALERTLLEAGNDVARVPPKLMGASRASARTYGKSDAIDAKAVALAAIREPDLPRARVDAAGRDLKLLVAHREDLVAERTRVQNRLRVHLHQLEVGLQVPPGALSRPGWVAAVRSTVAGLPQGVQRWVAMDLLGRCEELSADVRAVDRQIEALVGARPDGRALQGIVGCGALTAAALIAATDGVARFRAEGRFASHAGVAPVPASSGGRVRHRLNRHGDRRLNLALHRIAFTQARMHPPAKAYLARKRAEGKSFKEALRCLKRHVARTVYKTLVASSPARA